MRTCEAPDCLRPTRNGRYCEAHAKRLQRGASLGPVQEARTPWERFVDAVLRYAEAEEDADYQRAEWNLKDAARRWVKQDVGGRIGRPPTVDAGCAWRLFRELRSVRATARALGTSRQSVRRALGRAGVRKFRTGGDVRGLGEG